MRIADDHFECDRCGGDCGNGGVASCVVVSDIDPDAGLVVNYHFCRENRCDKKVLSKANRKHYLEQKEKDSE